MRITDVKITKIEGDHNTNMRAYVAFTIDGEFVVHGAKIIEGNKGIFVAMPQEVSYDKNTGMKEFLDICHPIKTDTRNKITEAVLDAYYKLLDKENDNEGYINE